MKICSRCGREIADTALFCPGCGNSVSGNNNSANTNDIPDNLFAVLGFLIPIVGVLLFLIYEDKKPSRAGSSGKGALIGFIVRIIIYVILAVKVALLDGLFL